MNLYSQRRDEVVHESGGLRYRIAKRQTGSSRRHSEAFRDGPLHLPKRTVISRERDRRLWLAKNH